MPDEHDQQAVSAEGLDLLRALAADDARLSDSERAMLALAVVELEQRRDRSRGSGGAA